MLVVGAMKCGTTALHGLLDRHPGIAMAEAKEVNFFFGPDEPPHDDADRWWIDGQWHRGLEWYGSLFDPAVPVRGESSPGYTDPEHPEAPARIAELLPEVRLVYLVRDPVERAVSQWRHHCREGTEHRAVEEAVLDPDSQYVARSRFHERIAPYLARFRRDQLLVVAQEDLRTRRRTTLRLVFEHVGADPDHWDDGLGVDAEPFPAAPPAAVPESLRAAVWERVADDADRLADLVGHDLLRRPSARGPDCRS